MQTLQKSIAILSVVLLSCNPLLKEPAAKETNSQEENELKEYNQLNYDKDTSFFKYIFIDSSGNLEYAINSNGSNKCFSIQEFRWNKWTELYKVEETSSTDFNIKLDTTCGLFKLRVLAIESDTLYSTFVDYPIESSISLLSNCFPKTKMLRLSRPSKYEVYNTKGETIQQGCDSVIFIKDSIENSYYISYSNKTEYVKFRVSDVTLFL